MEDSSADARLVREALAKHCVACELVVVTNGQRAIEFIDEIDKGALRCPDLVIVDLNLPKRSGVDVVQRLRASAKCQNAPIVVLTSSDNQKDKDSVSSARVAKYIVKPSRLAEFIKLGRVFKEYLEPASETLE